MPARSSNWFGRMFNQKKTPIRNNNPHRPLRLGIESLEDRTVPAGTITIVEAGPGSLDGFLGVADGTILAADGGAADGTVSRAALQAVGAGTAISITAQNSIIFEAALAPIVLQTTTSATFQSQAGLIGFGQQSDSLSTAGGAISFLSNTDLTLGVLNSGGANINLTANRMDLGGAINAGAGTVFISSTVPTRIIDLGGPDVMGTALGVTDTELDQITAALVKVGNNAAGTNANTGGIQITSAISQGAGYNTLSLQTTAGVTNAAPLAVDSVAIRAGATVTLNNAGNDIESLAVLVAGAGNDLIVVDTDSLLFATVDGLNGLTVADDISITAGSIVSQAVGANVSGDTLELLGAGAYTLTNAGNDVNVLAAALTAPTGTLNYTDADDLLIGISGFGTQGVTTNNANITITTINGNLTIDNAATGTDIDAGSAMVNLTAQSTGAQNNAIDLQNNGGAGIIGTGGVTLTADNVSIADTVAAGPTALLQPFQAGTLINLGGADAGGTPGTLGLTDGELDLVTAGIIQIGNATAGDITVSAAISPAGTSQLELVTGAGVLDGSAGLDDITETRLGITAGTGIGVAGGDVFLDVMVSNFEATTATGGIQASNTGGPLTIGGVNAALTGVRTTTSGNIDISNNNSITVGTALVEGISTAGGGSITLTTTSTSINITATSSGVAATGGNGNVVITAEDDVNALAAISAVGTGDITIVAEPGGGAGSFTNTAAGTVTAELGDISITTADNVTLAGAVAVTAGTGTITIIAEPTVGPSAAAGNFMNSGTGTVTTAGGAISVRAGDGITVGAAISAGGAGTVTLLANAAIDTVGVVTSTAAISSASGAISIAGLNVNLNAGGTVSSTVGGGITIFGDAVGAPAVTSTSRPRSRRPAGTATSSSRPTPRAT